MRCTIHAQLYLVITFVAISWIAWHNKLKPLRREGVIDAIVPAFDEEVCIVDAVTRLTNNPYFRKVIVVNDGSTDRTAALLDRLAAENPKVVAVHQDNTGKGGAIMTGLRYVETPQVFLTDADTHLREHGDDLGYMLAELENGADAVGGVPLSNLDGAGLLPHVRASTKLAVITIQRTFQQLVGGAPFLISGACGLFRTEALRQVPFSDRTKVEDLDLTWSLVSEGFVVRQSNRSFVYSQEPNSLKTEWLRWRRWIVGYAVCMRHHRNLLRTRFGLLTIIPVFLSSFIAFAYMMHGLTVAMMRDGVTAAPQHLLPWGWMLIIYAVGASAAIHYRKPWLMFLAPAALVYVVMAYSIWMIHGLGALFSGREPRRDKPARYAHVVA